MSDEAAFLKVLAEAPTDDTARLVYADWLDEHGEPARAAYLRAEVAWAALPPPARLVRELGKQFVADDHYPPALHRLTDLAEQVSPEWLAVVSRIGHESRALADRFLARVPGSVSQGRRLEPEARVTKWLTGVERARTMFADFVGEAVTRERFRVPVDYVAFQLTVGGLTCPDEFGMTYFDSLPGPVVMADHTLSFCEMYAEEHGRGEQLAACGLWLFVGYRDKHDFHLCCDRASPLFGTLADMHDSHPWIEPPHGPAPSEIETRSFLDFLRHQTEKAEG